MKPFPGFRWSTKYFLGINLLFFSSKLLTALPLQPVALLTSPNLQPRLAKKAADLGAKIGETADKISECNTEGIVGGFTHAQLNSG